jgi:hypothetical protein
MVRKESRRSVRLPADDATLEPGDNSPGSFPKEGAPKHVLMRLPDGRIAEVHPNSVLIAEEWGWVRHDPNS